MRDMSDWNLLNHGLFNLDCLDNWNVLDDFVGFWNFDSLCHGNFLDNFNFLDDFDRFFNVLDDFNDLDDFLDDWHMLDDFNFLDNFNCEARKIVGICKTL